MKDTCAGYKALIGPTGQLQEQTGGPWGGGWAVGAPEGVTGGGADGVGGEGAAGRATGGYHRMG